MLAGVLMILLLLRRSIDHTAGNKSTQEVHNRPCIVHTADQFYSICHCTCEHLVHLDLETIVQK